MNRYLASMLSQLQVWDALPGIPPGTRVTYQDLAAQIGTPRAAAGAAGRGAVVPHPTVTHNAAIHDPGE
jgi:O6-methylguanine-DNA--protein-cysteine methyltransferase